MEDDLTWLARNVTDSHMCDWYIKVADGYSSMTGGTPTGMSGTWCSRKQIIQRRAELQNKPSWKDAPEWATELAQDSNGKWFFYADTPTAGQASWCVEGTGDNELSGRGEVLGDWRDTLERRPADLSSAAVIKRLDEATQNVLAAVPALMDEKYSFEPEFMPVSVSNETVQLERPIAGTGTGMSIGEWAAKYSGKTPSAQIREAVLNEALRILRDHPDHFSADGLADLNELTGAELTKRDERVCGGQKYIDAHWFERGELPPVGTACEAFGKFPTAPCEIIAYSPEQVAIRWLDNGLLDVIGKGMTDFYQDPLPSRLA